MKIENRLDIEHIKNNLYLILMGNSGVSIVAIIFLDTVIMGPCSLQCIMKDVQMCSM